MLSTTPDNCSVSRNRPQPATSASEVEARTSSEPEYLSECSPRDRPWDKHRSQADQVAAIYSAARESVWFCRLGERIEECAQFLGFAWAPEKNDSSVLTLKLREARFCRARHCPVCQWRRSLMWIARFLAAAPAVLAEHPKARFIFLTVTQKNVPVDGLRAALHEMSKAWDRLRKRKEFRAVLGWIRAVEVTRAENGSAHPHYHALLLVPGSYFRSPEKYVTQAVWAKIWGESLRVDYEPIVYVAAVRRKRTVARMATAEPAASTGLMDAARETLKYAVKSSDLVADANWLLQLTRQLHKLRFIASGGVLKDVLREKEENNEDLLVLGEGEADEGHKLFFDWWRPVRRYKRRGRIQ